MADAFRPRDLLPGLMGAGVLAVVELALLAPLSLELVVAVITMFAALGLAAGLVMATAELVVRSAELESWRAAGMRALGSVLVTIPVASSLFEGAFAATLPGAAWGHLWVPVLGLVVLAAALRVAEIFWRRFPVPSALAVLLAAALTEFVNRTRYRSEYPDIHTMLLVVALIGTGVATRTLLEARRRAPIQPFLGRPRLATTALLSLVLAVSTGLALVLQLGLRDDESRWVVAKRGMHARLLVRVGRTLDFDGDGLPGVLGGADCDDWDARVHPAAPEVEGNELDDDCDGRVDELPAPRQADGPWRDAETDDALAAVRSEQRRELLARTRSMNVLLIVVDALRADLLTDTEANRSDLPNLFRLRDESRWFSRAFAPGAGTDVSMAGVFTGRINPWQPIDATLAEELRATGRRTHAVVPNEVFYFAGKTLLTRGLDDHDRLINDLHERNVSSFASSKRTTQLATAFLDRWTDATAQADAASQPFFLWLHYFDVHEHHQIPTGDRNLLVATNGRRGRTPEEKYRALGRLVDQNVGLLLDGLRASGRLDETIVVFMSDHGEGLRTDPRLPDHHGQFIYNDLVHVPLTVRVPGVAPRIIDEPVSLIDLYPTLIELAGATPSELADGMSLLPHLLAAEPRKDQVARVLPLNEVEQFGVIQWPYKLMVRLGDNLTEVYDLSTDWEERHDMAAAEPELTNRLREAYYQLPRVVVDRTRKARRTHELSGRTP